MRVVKTVTYRCGCVLELSAFGKTGCGKVCEKHLAPIQRMVTTEEFM